MRLLYSYLIAILFTACSTSSYPVFDSYPTGNEPETPYRHAVIENNDVQLQLSYIADGGDYLIYELWAAHNDSDPIQLSHQDIVMYYQGRISPDTTRAINPEQFIEYLRNLTDNERYAKKSNNVGLALLGGLSILSYAISPEASAVGVAAIGLDYALGAAEENAWRNDRIKSIEDEITYMDSSVLYEDIVQPGDTVIYDILFSRDQVPLSPVTIQVDWGGELYFFDFTNVMK